MIKNFIVLLSILYLNTAFIVFEKEKSKEKNKPEIKVNLKFDKDEFDDDDDYDEPTTKGPALADGCAFHIFWRCASSEDRMNYVWHPFCVKGRCCGRTIPEEQDPKPTKETYQRRFNGRE